MKPTPVMSMFVLALAVWAGGNTLAAHLGQAHERTAAAQRGTQQLALPPEVKALEQQVQNEPDNIDARLALGRALVDTGHQEQEAGYLMKAVEAFGAVLKKDPNHRESLMALGELCFESGLVDLAEGYYQRLLKLEPGNVKAATDYGLVQLQLGKTAEAVSDLKQIVGKNPKLFPPRLALALAYSVSGNREQAQNTARAALKIAPDESARKHVEQFMRSLANPPKVTQSTAPVDTQKLSPAMLVEDTVRSHPILGPKLEGLRWISAAEVEIKLHDFPVEQMPPFARAKLESRFKENLATLPDKTDLVFVDAANGKELMRISVGG